MEKQTPHYNLAVVKARVLRDGIFTFTASARRGAAAMGLSETDAVGLVLGLRRNQCFKSMTTFADHTIWQDVYHALCPNGRTAYVKLTLQDGALVIQFKEK